MQRIELAADMGRMPSHRSAPLALPHALTLADDLRRRVQADDGHGRLIPDVWIPAACRARRAGRSDALAALLRIELAPAVAEGAVTLAGAVELADSWPDAHGPAWAVDTIERIELAAAVLRHAAIVVGFAVGAEGEPPGLPVLLLRAAGLRLAAEGGDVRPLVAASLADALRDALRAVVGPVVALVDDLERGPADVSTLAAVLRVSLDAYQAAAVAGLALVVAEGFAGAPSCAAIGGG